VALVVDYRTVKLPADLAESVDAYVEENELGYRNRAEVVHAAVREFLERRAVERQADDVLDRIEDEFMDWMEEQRGRA
jgi:Arc/MetJ-type ribon-helix-helix transcriptional regulator